MNLSEQRILLQNISWQLFENLLSELGEYRSTRFTYHQRNLEIMTPYWQHEESKRLVERLIDTLTEELNLEVKMGGSALLKNPSMGIGKSADSCYYIHNEVKVRSHKTIDLAVDPPPDLVLDIDLSNSALNQFVIYGNLGIPEIWRYDGETLFFYQFTHGTYVPVDQSVSFPFLTVAQVQEFMEHSHKMGVTSALRHFRGIVQEMGLVNR